MKVARHTDKCRTKNMKQSYESKKTSVNMLLGLAAATTCGALAVKILKKGELAVLMTLMALPVGLIFLNRDKPAK